MGAFRYAAVLAACSLWLSPSLATAEPAPGEGVYCALAIYSVVSQVAQVCRPTEAPKFQAGLNDAVARLGDYVVKNGGGSRADVERFKKEQGGVGTPKDKLCQGDPLMMYEALKEAGAEVLTKSVDQAVARPGKPSWGTCL